MTNPQKGIRLLLVILIALTLLSIFLALFHPRQDFDKDFSQAIAEYVSNFKPKEPIDGIDGRDGLDGRNGYDGRDGRDGKDGRDGVDGTNGVDGLPGKDGYTPVKDVDYFDGKTPDIRCNEEANRWEIRYSPDENYQVLNGQETKCTVGKSGEAP